MPWSNTMAWVFAGASAAIAAGAWVGALALAAIVVAAALLVSGLHMVRKGNGDALLVVWVFLFPLGYYFLSFPHNKPVLSFDRIVAMILFACLLNAPLRQVWGVPRDIKRTAIAWGIFLLITLLSFFKAENAISVARTVLDAFLLPVLLGWYVLRQFRLSAHAKWLHIGICAISIYCCAIGIAEVALHRDLLALQSSGEYLAYDPTDPSGLIFLRPNGPFETDGSFALVGLISFFLLGFLWKQIGQESGLPRKALHIMGCSAALIQALLPLFRSVFLTVALVLIVDVFLTTGFRRVVRIVALASLPALVLALILVAPGVMQDRLDPANALGRMAQNEQTLKMLEDHFWTGIGLSNFNRVAKNSAKYQASSYVGLAPANYPHNNLGWLAVETGLLGFIPYVCAQAFLVAAFWNLRKRGERGRHTWRYFIFIFLTYWVTGITETTGAYGDLNMWFMLAVGLLYRFGIGEHKETAALPAPVATGC
jgi:hypothetical protein